MDKKSLMYYITMLLLISGVVILFNGLKLPGLILLFILLVITLINFFVFHDKRVSIINLLVIYLIILVYSVLQNYLDVLKIVIGCLAILLAVIKFIIGYINNKPKKLKNIIDCEYHINE
jgi:hypothetical protein